MTDNCKPSRNRAKCKKCGDIIESKDQYDFVRCSCKEISIDGGKEVYRRYSAIDFSNFLIVNDDDSEVEIQIKYQQEENKKEEVIKDQQSPPNREDLLKMFEAHLKHTQTLPSHVKHSFVTYDELDSALSLIYAILIAKN